MFHAAGISWTLSSHASEAANFSLFIGNHDNLHKVAARIREGQARGAVARAHHPYAAAVALAAILERLAAHHRDMGFFGVTRDDLRETCARILLQTLTGRAASD